MTGLMIVLLILVLLILVGNTMIAVAFLRGRGANLRSMRGPDRDAMDELHRRVQSLPPKDE